MTKNELVAACVNEYGRDVYAFCLHLTRSKADADDLYQEVFLKLTEKADAVDPLKNTKSYLLSMVVNIWRNERRLRWRRDYRSGNIIPIDDVTPDGALIAEQIADENPMPEDIAEKNELKELVKGAVDALPERLKVVVLLYYQSELCVKEIGEVLKIPQGTVKSRLSNARGCIRKHLKGRLKGYEYKIS